MINPLGFQVSRYRKDAETLPEAAPLAPAGPPAPYAPPAIAPVRVQ